MAMTTQTEILEPPVIGDIEAIKADREKLWERLMELRSEAIEKGMKLHTVDEVMDAFAEERAGGEGLARLWQ
jgi:hypothetical protein